MKKFLSFVLSALALVSCKDEIGTPDPGSQPSGGDQPSGGSTVEASIDVAFTEIELSDLTAEGKSESALIPVSISPVEAGISDVEVSSSDKDVHAELREQDGGFKLLISIPSNPEHKPTNVRTATVTLKPKKGPAASVKVSVGIRGHVTGLTLTPASQFLENGEVHFTVGEKVALRPALTKTGELKAGGDKIIYYCPNGLTVTDNNLYCLNSASPTGGSASLTLTAQCGLSPKVELKIHTYAVPTGFEIDPHLPANLGGNYFQKGTSYIVSVKVLPSTARQYVNAACSVSQDYLVFSTTQTSTLTKLDIQAKKSTQNQEKFTFTAGTYTETWYFAINDYLAGDVKIGDYVYRTSTGGVRRSDGGLRASGTDANGKFWVRQSSVNSNQQSGETLLGIVFDTGLTFVSDLPSNMKAGVKGDDGVTKHVGVLALQDAHSQTCNWGSASSNWGSFVPSYQSSNTYLIYKAVYAKGYYTVTFNQYLDAFKNTKPLPTTGTTPWMLPSCEDFKFMSQYGKVLNHNGAAFSGYYWTACIDPKNDSLAGAANWSGDSCTVSMIYKNGNGKLRPVFFL